MYVYIYIYTYIHTYIHVFIHIYISPIYIPYAGVPHAPGPDDERRESSQHVVDLYFSVDT